MAWHAASPRKAAGNRTRSSTPTWGGCLQTLPFKSSSEESVSEMPRVRVGEVCEVGCDEVKGGEVEGEELPGCARTWVPSCTSIAPSLSALVVECVATSPRPRRRHALRPSRLASPIILWHLASPRKAAGNRTRSSTHHDDGVDSVPRTLPLNWFGVNEPRPTRKSEGAGCTMMSPGGWLLAH